MAGQQVRFGEQLRRHRETAALSQEELAERAGLSANAISALERGERKRPYPDTLRRLGDALGLDADARSGLAASLRSGGEEASVPLPPGRPLFPVAALPGEPTPFIGRDREAGVVRHLLTHGEGRLLTLIGPGGVGKTRLALNVARDVGDQFPDGVVWVELAPLGDPALVMPTIARAFELEDVALADPASGPRAWIRERHVLLVLDNVEHVLDAVPDLARLLMDCPNVHILATSRSPLRIRGEQEYLVPPLELPPAGPAQDEETLRSVSSVQYFTWQARQRNPSFALTPDNAADVAAICRRLDGLPLALELVAARIRALEPAALLARLDHMLPLLTGGARDLPTRQQTMRAAIAWSHALLPPGGLELFRRLAVFAGGWTLDAAAALTPGQGGGDDELFDRLEALIEQSLVTVTHDVHGTRYGMLEPIRQFAQEQLEASGEGADTQRRHAMYYLVLAEQAGRELEGRTGQAALLARLEQEHDNLRAALAWSERVPDGAETGLRMGASLWRFWEMRWCVDEGSRWLSGALSRSEGQEPALRARALSAAGNLARDLANHDQATVYHEESLALRRTLGDTLGIARSLNNLGVIARDRGEPEVTLRLGLESLDLFRAAGDRHGAAIALIGLGTAAGQQGDLAKAAVFYDESLSLFRAEGDTWHTAWVLTYHAELQSRYGEFATALPMAAEGLDLHREANDVWGQAMALGILGRAAQAAGDLDAACAQVFEALRLLVVARVERAIPIVLDDLACILLARGEPDRAARLAGASEVLRASGNVDRVLGERDPGLAGLQFGPHAVSWSAGRAMTRDQVLARAMDLAAELAIPAPEIDEPS